MEPETAPGAVSLEPGLKSLPMTMRGNVDSLRLTHRASCTLQSMVRAIPTQSNREASYHSHNASYT